MARPLPLHLARQFRETLRWEVESGQSGSAFFNHQVDPSRSDWDVLNTRRWRFPCHKNEGELEAFLLRVKWAGRRHSFRGSVLPFLTDSSIALGCIRKGRSPKYNLRRRLQRLLALTLVFDFGICVRWVPTALCAADAPSRPWGNGPVGFARASSSGHVPEFSAAFLRFSADPFRIGSVVVSRSTLGLSFG